MSSNDDDKNNFEDKQNVNSGQKRKRETVDDGYGSSDEESSNSDVEEASNCESEEESDSDSASGSESDDDDDGSDSDDEECSSSSSIKEHNSTKDVESDGSTSDPDSREICAICLSYMKGEIGSPELCDHSFCLECILEWAKTNNSCPQDRTQFLQVFVRKKVKGKIIRIIKVEEVKPDDIPADEEEEPTFCEICGRCDREDSLLLCDGCDSGHHLECLSPPLNSVPIEEWYCNECQAVDRLTTRRTRNTDVIELEEVTSLIDEAGVETRITGDRNIRLGTVSRRFPRTRASERVRRRIQRVRTTREEAFQSLSYSEIEEEEDSEEEVELEVSTTTSTSKPARKKRKVTIRRKRKTKRKVVKRKRKTGIKKKTKKKSTTTKKKGTTVKKRRKTKGTKKKGTRKRKSTTKKRGAKWRKKKGKKKPKSQVVITPKARLAEALGIRPLKNPWQLSLPAMNGGLSQEGSSLTNQRWKAGVPSLSLLGSNTELDYLSEPDEFGDAILVAGVARRHQSTAEALARRKAMAVEVLSRSPYPTLRNLNSLPVNDSSVSSVGNLLDNIIQSQSILHKNSQKILNQKDSSTSIPDDQQGLAKQVGTGPDSPGKEGNNQVKSPPKDQNRNGQPRFIYGVYSTSKASDTFSNSTSFSRNPSNEDPTGSKAYSSYLKDHTHPDKSNLPESSNKDNKKAKKDDKRKKLEDDEVNLYSDIEPELPEPNEDESDNDDEVDNQASAKLQDHHDENESPLSGDELVIDDTREKALTNRSLSAGTIGENEVGSSNLPGLNDFELEAVSDTDTHEMDKSMSSSISFSDTDSNMGDAEVTSSTNEVNVGESELRNSSNRMVQLYNSTSKNNFEAVTKNQSIGMGLEGLETETISDNEEICFEDNYGNDDDDNIEEGEIPNENAPRALPSNRPKINIQLRRVIEVSSPNKEFEGECEEGEIIDESAAKREKKREKAKRDVEEVVNQQMDEEIKENGDKENNIPDVNIQLIPHPEVEINVAEKVLINPDDVTSKPKDKKEKQVEKDKEKEKDKDKTKDKPRDKDIAFKKVSRNTKIRNYRDNDKDFRNKRRGSRERSHSRDRGYSREREYSRERGRARERNRDGGGGHSGDRYRRRDKDRKKEPKRKEMERYNVRQMINKKEEERKKKDEFGRDVSMREVRPSRSRSQSKGRGRRGRRSGSRSKKGSTSAKNKDKFRKSFSRSRSKSNNLSRSRKRRRSSYSSSSSSSSSTSSSSSSSSYSSSSSSSSRSRSRSRKTRKRLSKSRSRSKSIPKKVEKKKIIPPKPKEKVKKVIVSPQKKKVEEKKKEKRKEKEDPKIEKPKKKKKRDKTPLQSKEVYQAGGSIMVSVNFSRNTAKENKDPKKKKDKEIKVDDSKKKKKVDKTGASSPYHPWSPQTHSGSPVGKHTPLQDEPMWSPDTLHHQARASENAKSPEIIDLDVIMVTPPPQEPILISDSEEEEEGITRLPPDLGMQQCSPVTRNQGPKTPPEPGVKFTLSTKQALKPITNPLRDDEEEDHSVPVPSRGPNTPPGPPPESDESVGRPKSPIRRMPRSPVGTPPASSPEPDVYDPFEPTKSPSPPTRSPQQEARVSSSDQTDQISLKSPGTHSPSKSASSPPPPPPPSEPPQSEDRPPEPQKAPEDEASTTSAPHAPQPATVTISTSAPPPPIIPHSVAAPPNQIVTSLPGVISISSTHTLPPITTHTNTQPLNQMQQIFAGLPANVASILYPAALAAAAMRGAATNTLLRHPTGQPLVPDFSRPPPVTPGMLSRPPPISPLKVGKITQNGQNAVDVVDMDLGSPTSPDSSDVSDMFEPPSPLNVSPQKTSPRKPRPTPQKISPTKQPKHDKFDALFGSSNDSRNKTPHKSKPNINSKLNKLKHTGGKKAENEEDIPSSAVDLQVKEKLLKKVQRQERVVDEVKLCLKPFYNKKTINKDDYKDIMKRCVQKVCHTKSGEINPNKIRSLVEGYIKKVKYYRKKHGIGGLGGILSQIKSGTVLPPTVNDPPPPGFALKSHTKLKP